MSEDRMRVLDLDDLDQENDCNEWNRIEGEDEERRRRSLAVKYPGEDAEEEKGEEKGSPMREAIGWTLTFLIAIIVALALKNYVIINATVPTGSMEHTIEPKDCLFGLRLSYTFSAPERGDIVIFNAPDNASEKYVKRVIGLPGEKIRIENANIYIDDSKEPLQESYLKEEWVKATGPYEFEVPEGCYLMLGDNRNDSLDARYWKNTYVSEDAIIGKAYVIYYPFSRFGSLYKK